MRSPRLFLVVSKRTARFRKLPARIQLRGRSYFFFFFAFFLADFLAAFFFLATVTSSVKEFAASATCPPSSTADRQTRSQTTQPTKIRHARRRIGRNQSR